MIYTIATAGHIDHGKSTLVKALTGINPDRLPEELEREMTIDLGFAWVTLDENTEIGIVDVPGHERFIRNMISGVGGIDYVLFIVAADDGWMPQSQEHLEILEAAGKNYTLYMLSNSNAIHYDFFVKDLKDHFGYQDFDALFKKAYFSFRLHMHKPNTDIYHYVIGQEKFDPSKTLFIDDRADNIEGARNAGLKTYHLDLTKGASITRMFDKDGLLLENLEIR